MIEGIIKEELEECGDWFTIYDKNIYALIISNKGNDAGSYSTAEFAKVIADRIREEL